MESQKNSQAEQAAEQAATRREQMEELLQSKGAEFVSDLGNLTKQPHNWVRRGIKVSCEGAGHPHHSHFLTDRNN